MPRYFFNIQRGDETIIDEEGIDLPDIDAVRLEARQGAKEILSEDLLKEVDHPHQAFIVRDETGQIVLTLDMKLSANLAVSGGSHLEKAQTLH